MQTENLIFDDSCQGQEIEQFSELFPYIRTAILAQALIVEAITENKSKGKPQNFNEVEVTRNRQFCRQTRINYLHLCDLPTLMIASKDGDSIWEAYLESHQKRDGLDAVVATVDIVTHEEVVCVRGLTSNLEELA